MMNWCPAGMSLKVFLPLCHYSCPSGYFYRSTKYSCANRKLPSSRKLTNSLVSGYHSVFYTVLNIQVDIENHERLNVVYSLVQSQLWLVSNWSDSVHRKRGAREERNQNINMSLALEAPTTSIN